MIKRKELQKKSLAAVMAASMTMSLLPGTVLADSASGVLADGTYESTAHVTRTAEDDEDENAWDEYDVNVKITVADGKFSDIAVTPGSGYNTENATYFKKAATNSKGFKTKLLGKDATIENIEGWDIVSGATRTSNAVKTAALAATQKATPTPEAVDTIKLLEERRSIRAFDPEKHVTAEQIQEIVQAAIQAPSWKNSQTTRYYALVTPEKVEEFSAKCLPEFNQKSSKGAALVVTAFVKDRSGFTQDGTPDNEVGNGWGYYDLGLHDENLILRARELGLDTLIMGIRDEKAIREALSIPENELLGAVIAVGYRAINPDKPKRKTVDDILKLF